MHARAAEKSIGRPLGRNEKSLPPRTAGSAGSQIRIRSWLPLPSIEQVARAGSPRHFGWALLVLERALIVRIDED